MIYIDLTIFSIQKMGGISVVWSEYLKKLRNIGHDLEITLLLPENSNRIASSVNLEEYNVQSIKPRGILSKYLPFFFLGSPDDILHTSYYQWFPLFRGVKIVTLHDFMHEKFAPLKSRVLHNTLKYLCLKSADVVLCISEATRRDFEEIYHDIYVAKDVRVIENSVGTEFYPDPAQPEHNNMFLWVAGRTGYKNFRLAMKLLSYLKANDRIYFLSVVGPPLSEDEIKYAESLNILDQIKVHSDISVAKLRSMYSNALALLYLSKYEGFGLPILEAQKCLCPVIALSNPASEEVGADSILYIDNNREEDILEVLERIENPAARELIVKKGQDNAARYSWDNSVQKLVNVYREYQNG